MKLNHKEELKAAIIPLHVLSRVVGLAPFNTDFESSRPAKVYSFLLAFMMLWRALFEIFFSQATMMFKSKSPLWVIPRVLMLFLATLTSLLSLKTAIFNSAQCLKQIFIKVVNIDKVLYRNTSVYDNAKWCLLVEVAIMVVGTGGAFIIELWDRRAYYYPGIAFRYLTLTITRVLVIQFVNCVLLLRTRFASVNLELKRFLTSLEQQTKSRIDVQQQNVSPGVMKTLQLNQVHPQRINKHAVFVINNHVKCNNKIFSEQLPSKIRTLRRIFNELHQISELLNTNYGFVTLLQVTYLIISFTTYLYAVTLSFYLHEGLKESLMYMNSLAINVLSLVIIAAVCHLSSDEANQSSLLLQQLLVHKDLKPDVEQELLKFAQQLMANKVEFTAYGFFNLDFALLLSTAGTVTSYIVIMLQLNPEIQQGH